MLNANEITSLLKREFLNIWVIGLVLFMSCYLSIGITWHWSAANQWLFQAGLLWLLVYRQTSVRLHLNRPTLDSELYVKIGWANRLTIIRGGLIAATGGFIFQDWPPLYLICLPGLLYTLAAIIDRIDGFIARKTRQQSLLGSELDTAFDALGLAIAPILAVWYGQIHWSYLLVSSAYYLFQLGIYYRRKRDLPIYELPATLSSRALAGFQMGFIAAILWPVFQPPATIIAGVAFMVPVMVGFTIDWLIVSGRINRQSSTSLKFFNRFHFVREYIFQPLLRITIAILFFNLSGNSGYSLMFGEHASFYPQLYIFSLFLTTISVLIGFIGRLSAVVLATLLGWHYLSHPVNIADVILLCSVIWIMLMGTGRFSFWKWDEDWVNRYDGA